MPRRPFIRDHGTAVLVGLALLVAALVVLWDAYERRGKRTPLPLRPILPF